MRQRVEARLILKAKRAEEKKYSSRKAMELRIDWEEIKRLLIVGLNGVQICEVLDIDNSTLYSRCITDNLIEWSRFKRIYSTKGVEEILTTQHQLAIAERDRGMLIWLGKCRAGQIDMALAPRADNEKQVTELLSAVLKYAAKD